MALIVNGLNKREIPNPGRKYEEIFNGKTF